MQNMQHEKAIGNVELLQQIGNIKLSPCRTFHKLDEVALYDRKFQDVEKFHHPGLAPVSDSSGGYHIDFNGSEIYKKRFDKTFGFYCSRAAVIDNEKYYHIDPEGKRIYKDFYDWCGNYQEDKCVVRKERNFFHIDINGNKIYRENYDYVGDFKDNIAVVYKSGKASHINQKGQLIHNKWYKKLGVFHKNYANAEDDRGWFHINIFGDPIYEYRYKMVEPFYNNCAKVETFSGKLEQINLTGKSSHVISLPNSFEQMHRISSELVGFWNTYLFNATAQTGILKLLPRSIPDLAKKLNANEYYLERFLRALWEINLINYNKDQDLWELAEKGSFLIDHPFLMKAAKMWGRVITESNWLNIPALIQQKEMQSFPTFKEKEQNNDIKAELYQVLIGYSKYDFESFLEKIDIKQNEQILLLGVHSLALIDSFKKNNIHFIDYYNDPILPVELTKDFNINIKEKDNLIKEYDIAILGRFFQHQDNKSVLAFLNLLKNGKISRIILVETIIDKKSPVGGVVDINIMVESGGKLRSISDWNKLLKQAGGFSIKKVTSLTDYLSVIEIIRGG